MSIEQRASNGVLEKVDNFILQNILIMVKDTNIKNGEMKVFKLGACPFCSKQRIFIEDSENEDYVSEKCVFCEKPVTETVLVYQYESGKQLICLESEAEALLEK